ncbi:MAG: hypothetical protein M3011_00070 [Actinomycetota bacterium]|nr:hypothetical protein [Actinomycetota bacterium]
MMATTCPHGLIAGECLICSTLAGTPTATPRPEAGPRRSTVRRPRRGGAGLVIAVVAVLLVGWWLVALVSLIFRLATLVAIAAGSGWVGWRLGVRHGRRTSSG